MIDYPANWDKCEAEYLEPPGLEEEPELEEFECENCGIISNKTTCSKECYKIMKAEYEAERREF
tara:strand:+ start:443 stop:634 length:192 start_codon:yes stop_codon:yes gene_type:complete